MKKTKRWMIFATGLLCVGALAAAAACGADPQTPSEDSVGVTGSVLFLQDGTPDRKLGNSGDVCFVTSTGMVYRKDGAEWLQTEFDEYTVEGERLSVTYADGTFGTYEIAAPQADDEAATPCEHTDLGDPVTIYPALCVVPGIGVQTCSDCHESFVEILPADPANHEFNADNYGRCDICDHVESGVVGYEAKGSDELKELFSEEKLEDGDTVVLQGGAQITAADQLGIDEDKNITLDVHGNQFDFQKDSNNLENAKENIVVGAGGSLTITDTSENHSGSFDITVTEAGGNYIDTGKVQNGRPVYARGAVSILAQGTAENRAQLNFENVDVNINDVNYMNLVINAINADVNLGEGTKFNVSGTSYTGAIYASAGTVVTIDGAEINTKGDVTPFVVGSFGEAATLNFENGAINMDSPSDRMFGIQVNGGGHVNMTGGKINITGDLRSKINGGDVAVAIGVDNRDYADWIDPKNTDLGYKWICVESSINITGGTINLAPSYGTAYGIVSWPGNADINIFGMTMICQAHDADGAGQGGHVYALCCSKLNGTVSPHMYLGDGLIIQLEPTGRNLLFSSRENGGDKIAPDWEAGGDNIFDKTSDHIFGDKYADKYGGQFIQPYEG